MGERTGLASKTTEKKALNPVAAKSRKDFSQSIDSPVEQILYLQQTIGNQAVQRLIESGTIQARLTIGKPNNKYEQEADRIADRVVNMKEPKGSTVKSHSSLVQRKSTCPECPEKEGIQTKLLADQITPLVQRQVDEEEEPVQTKRIQRQGTEEEEEPVQTKLVQRQEAEEEEELQTKLQRQPEEEEEEPIQRQPQEEEEKEPIQTKPASNQTPAGTSNIESSVNSLKGGGQALSESSRSYFEPRFGADFSKVRVHTNSQAADTAKSINAKAFTTGKDVVFGAGQYSPETSTGKRLLAHELTHVVQQKKKNNTIQRWNLKGHKDLTYKAAKGILDPLFTYHVASWSFVMDYKAKRIRTGLPYKLGIKKGEGPEHGEDGNYSTTSESTARATNLRVQNEYLVKAVKATIKYDKMKKRFLKHATLGGLYRLGEAAKEIYSNLGDACHIAQDRGAHWEGVKGMGHDHPLAKVRLWKADSPSDNSNGYKIAKDNTIKLLNDYKASIPLHSKQSSTSKGRPSPPKPSKSKSKGTTSKTSTGVPSKGSYKKGIKVSIAFLVKRLKHYKYLKKGQNVFIHNKKLQRGKPQSGFIALRLKKSGILLGAFVDFIPIKRIKGGRWQIKVYSNIHFINLKGIQLIFFRAPKFYTTKK